MRLGQAAGLQCSCFPGAILENLTTPCFNQSARKMNFDARLDCLPDDENAAPERLEGAGALNPALVETTNSRFVRVRHPMPT